MSANDTTKLKTLKPFARIEKGRISTVYDTISGVKAMLMTYQWASVARIIEDVLVGRIEKKDEGDDSVSSRGTAAKCVLRGADGLTNEEQDHTAARDKEERPPSRNIDEE